jgi:hypothetical protein
MTMPLGLINKTLEKIENTRPSRGSSAEQAHSEFLNQTNRMISVLRADIDDDSQLKAVLADLENMRQQAPEEFVKTVVEFNDQETIKQYQETDPNFTPQSAAVRGFGQTATAGIYNKAAAYANAGITALTSDKKFGEALDGEFERERLLAKANPTASMAGNISGFVLPQSLGGKLVTRGSALGARSVEALPAFVKGLSGNREISTKIANLLTQNFVAKSAGAGFGGAAAYEAVSKSVELADQVARGKMSISEAKQHYVESVGEASKMGAGYGALFAAAGMGAVKTVQLGSRAVTEGMKKAGNLLGKDLKYAMDHADVVQEAFTKNPSLVIAESAETIAPFVQKAQANLKSVQLQAKNEILAELKNAQVTLGKELQNSALSLNAAVNDLRQAGLKDVATAARRVKDEVGNSYSRINSRYGKKLDDVLKTATAPADLTRALDRVQMELMKNGGMDKSGRLLPGSQFAKTDPDLFMKLSEYYQRLGGEVRASGGRAGVNVNLRDSVMLKKEIGELANFGSKPNNYERVMRGLYDDVKAATESADDRLRDINTEYMVDRRKIDGLRKVIGNDEQRAMNIVKRDLLDNKNLYTRELLEGLSQVSDKASLEAVKAAFEASDKFQVLTQFKANPRQAFTQVRAAFVAEDQAMIRQLDEMANRFPQLRPHLNTARAQAEALKALPNRTQVNQAMQTGQGLEEMQASLPSAEKAIQNAQAAKQQAAELQKVIGQDRLAAEQALSKPNFGQSPIEQNVIQRTMGESPEAMQALKRAEGARVANRLQTGEGMQKSVFEQLPVIGDTIFTLRKSATPLAARYFMQIAQSPVKTRKALIGDLLEKISGTRELPREQMQKLSREIGPEAAIVIYMEKGGAKDLQRAAEAVASAYEEGDNSSVR